MTTIRRHRIEKTPTDLAVVTVGFNIFKVTGPGLSLLKL